MSHLFAANAVVVDVRCEDHYMGRSRGREHVGPWSPTHASRFSCDLAIIDARRQDCLRHLFRFERDVTAAALTVNTHQNFLVRL